MIWWGLEWIFYPQLTHNLPPHPHHPVEYSLSYLLRSQIGFHSLRADWIYLDFSRDLTSARVRFAVATLALSATGYGRPHVFCRPEDMTFIRGAIDLGPAEYSDFIMRAFINLQRYGGTKNGAHWELGLGVGMGT